ncbi:MULTISPECIES: hypothetical protein [Streptomyces]|uniref:Uncharacterized protein n=1 Tax=Streptomyces nymphaeiformis TaxID=2663842 RepID=A0A7W7U470_9ACTN|nr:MULTISPECIES: hypothetical protein [Streptomyces]MBB4984699.1 hypothetical protein [Streptomyces nymphaeiformis]
MPPVRGDQSAAEQRAARRAPHAAIVLGLSPSSKEADPFDYRRSKAPAGGTHSAS